MPTTIYITKWALNKNRIRVNGKMVSGIVRLDNATVDGRVGYSCSRTIKIADQRLYENVHFFYTKEEAVKYLRESRIRLVNEIDKGIDYFIKRIVFLQKRQERISDLRIEDIKIMRGNGGEGLDDLLDMVEGVTG